MANLSTYFSFAHFKCSIDYQDQFSSIWLYWSIVATNTWLLYILHLFSIYLYDPLFEPFISTEISIGSFLHKLNHNFSSFLFIKRNLHSLLHIKLIETKLQQLHNQLSFPSLMSLLAKWVFRFHSIMMLYIRDVYYKDYDHKIICNHT